MSSGFIPPSVAVASFELSSGDAEVFALALGPAGIPDVPIQHFMRREHFTNLVETGRFRMRRLDDHRDKFEGWSPAANQTERSSFEAQVNAQLPMTGTAVAQRSDEAVARTLFYIHCWFASYAESESMWREFAGNGTGVCIRTTTHRLMVAFNALPGFHRHAGFCYYRNENEPTPFVPSWAPAFRKLRAFQDEKEFRITHEIDVERDHVATAVEQYLGLAEAGRQQPLLAPFDSGPLFQEIVYGPAMSDIDRGETDMFIASALKGVTTRRSVFG